MELSLKSRLRAESEMRVDTELIYSLVRGFYTPCKEKLTLLLVLLSWNWNRLYTRRWWLDTRVRFTSWLLSIEGDEEMLKSREGSSFRSST